MVLRHFLAWLALCSVVAIRGAESVPAAAINFARVGYAGGGDALPHVPAKIAVEPGGGDDTAAIQNALDEIGRLPLGADGFRGAVVLRRGTYRIGGRLRLGTSGVVLRGENATLIATGHDRRTLVEIRGNAADRQLGPGIPVADEITPAGSHTVALTSVEGLRIGQRVVIRRPSTKEWIHALGMDQFTGSFKDQRLDWLPGTRDLEWERTIAAIVADTRTVVFDAPITTALEKKFGGGTVHTLTWPGRIASVGVEGITCVSEFDASRPHDEEHSWIAIALEAVENAWVRNVTARHFVSAAVWVGASARAVTVQDCRSEAPVGENAGWRRFAFYIGGQQTLVQHCTADEAREAFLVGHCSAGPNVFFQCTATRALADSGSIESFASGALFKNVVVEGAAINLSPLGARYQGAGIVADNSRIEFTTGSPSQQPPLLSVSPDKLPVHNDAPASSPAPGRASEPLKIENGHLTFGHEGLFATSSSNAWWKGQTIPARAAQLGWHPARWAPGRSGPGLTEDLAELALRLRTNDQRLAQVWPGLWYDRRRDDHKIASRLDAEVWAPFYEMPWARSGQGTASDGLSKYDLTRFNPWYWDRLRTFAAECAAQGVVVYHHFYNHHNLVEAAAHWADFPWREANCLQKTGFAEPPPYENDGKRIGIVAEFYDIAHPERRALHRRFIWHGLDVFADQPNVIHTLGFQFAGPLSFQQFFLDTAAEWKQATGRNVLVALNTSKTITDAILADPARAALVGVIDQRYWQYLPDGTLFAPHSDGRLAFREERAAAFGKDAVPTTTPALVYKQVREYRDRFPGKAIFTAHAGQGPIPILMAGGAYPLLHDFAASQPLKVDRDDRALFSFLRDHLADRLAHMKPVDDLATEAWALVAPDSAWLLYSATGDHIALQQPIAASGGEAWWFDVSTGATRATPAPTGTRLAKPSDGAWLLLVLKPAP
jgi:hypothetical protein